MLFGYVIEKNKDTVNYINSHIKRFTDNPLMTNFKQKTHVFNDKIVYECDGKVKFPHTALYLGILLIIVSIISNYIVNYKLGGDSILHFGNYFLIFLGIVFSMIDLIVRTRFFFWLSVKANLKDMINYTGNKRLLSKEEIYKIRERKIKPKF